MWLEQVEINWEAQKEQILANLESRFSFASTFSSSQLCIVKAKQLIFHSMPSNKWEKTM